MSQPFGLKNGRPGLLSRTVNHTPEAVPMSSNVSANRRDFLKTAATTSAVLAAGGALNAHAAGDDQIKVGLVGCGNRGGGAAENVLSSAQGVKIVALADVFKNKIEATRGRLT